MMELRIGTTIKRHSRQNGDTRSASSCLKNVLSHKFPHSVPDQAQQLTCVTQRKELLSLPSLSASNMILKK